MFENAHLLEGTALKKVIQIVKAQNEDSSVVRAMIKEAEEELTHYEDICSKYDELDADLVDLHDNWLLWDEEERLAYLIQLTK